MVEELPLVGRRIDKVDPVNQALNSSAIPINSVVEADLSKVRAPDDRAYVGLKAQPEWCRYNRGL